MVLVPVTAKIWLVNTVWQCSRVSCVTPCEQLVEMVQYIRALICYRRNKLAYHFLLQCSSPTSLLSAVYTYTFRVCRSWIVMLGFGSKLRLGPGFDSSGF